ncbi:hypothetical protein ETD83_26815 [Actinomadura soli]|uniref:Uncharacterized protein n=1 Tax=Actinomadura soli TaxID=2508997 RepID=A0A5C4J658_9ACTN|nr:hypothetical protein [Actinomadura soli]TMQ92655.1 hypothetical protein ETD83_26815 [Actinomadura soli]
MQRDAFLGEALIINENGPVAGNGELSTFTLVSADGASELSVQMASSLSDDFRDHLVARGFRVPEGSARAVTEIVTATAGNPAAWTAVGGMVVAFLRRHRGKVHRFKVEGRSYSVEGYSAKQAERLAKAMIEMSRDREDRG